MSVKCNKCKTSPRFGQDTWCIGCGAWEAIGRELTASWGQHAGLRRIADDIILSCARETRALRGLSAGFGPGTEQRAGGTPGEVKKEIAEPKEEATLTAQSKSAPSRPEEGASEYTYEEETSEESRQKETREKSVRPALPRHPGVDKAEKRPTEVERNLVAVKLEAGSSRASTKTRHPEEDTRRSDTRVDRERKRRRSDSRDNREAKAIPRDRRGKGKHKKTRRGGRKHQRLSRLQEDPHRPHHRKLSTAVLDERPHLE